MTTLSRSSVARCSLLLILAPVPAAAQTLRGRVVSADSTEPVPGVVVVLEDSSRRDVARSLSSPTGAFVLRATAPGAYRVRTLRIGFRPGEFGPYQLTAGAAADAVLPLRGLRTSLAAVRVVATSECRARDEGGDATLAVWEEARKALLLTVLARTDRRPTVVMDNYERVIDPRSGRVVRQTVQRRTGVSARPYVSPLSPDEYAARGYEEHDSQGATYRAPDADVLLTDSFAAAHCFQIVDSAGSAGTIGLAFRPAARRPGLVDVEGILWLDRASSELRTLEFRYVGLDPQILDAGGRMGFVALPTGVWMIDQWRISVPRVSASRRFEPTAAGSLSQSGSLAPRPVTRRAVVEVWEFGGRLSSVRVDTVVVWRGRAARLRGVVQDAETGMPVPGAGVSLRGTEYATRADDAGRFVLEDVLPGRYLVDARSLSITSLGLDGAVSASADLRDTATVAVTLRTPSLRNALARACAGRDRAGIDATTGVVQGFVRRAGDGAPLPGATVLARWLGRVDLRGSDVAGVSMQELQAATVTGPDGAFRFCGVDVGRPIRLTAARDSLESPVVVLRLSDTTLVTSVDLPVARTHPAAPTDSTSPIEVRMKRAAP